MSWTHPDEASQHSRAQAAATRQFGVVLLFASLTALFIATLAAVLITRAQAPSWPSHRLQELLPGLWAATALLALNSAALHKAWFALKANRERDFVRWLWVATLCIALFLLTQSQNFSHAWSADEARQNLYAFTFSLLTGVHALHVLGGLLPLAIVIHRASQREYSSSRTQGVLFCVQYWHFLGLIWLAILAVLLTG